jgi:hypothetical protein
VNRFLCPVCGYPALESPPEDYTICPSCGTEFGYDDFASNQQARVQRWATLRSAWLASGSPWFDSGTPRPGDWSPYLQLLRAGLTIKPVSSDSGSVKDVWTDRPVTRILMAGTAVA